MSNNQPMLELTTNAPTYFDTVQISGLHVSYRTSEVARVATVTEPNAGCGFYHYDRATVTKQQAFRLLKQAMIANLEEDILILQTRLKDLQELQP